MKPIPLIVPLLTVLGLSLFNSCSRITVANIESTTFEIKRGSPVVFENDDVRVTYNFWTKYGGGAMSFQIYNKLDEPIYIDWKNSGFIPNDQMMTYWQDETNTKGIATSAGYYYNGFGGSTAHVTTKSVRQERIAVIAPHAQIAKLDYALIPRPRKFVPKAPQKTDVPLPNDASKCVKTNGQEYSAAASPLKFRNYFTYSLSEKMDGQLRRVNNEFHIADLWSVKEAAYIRLKDNSAFFMR